MWPAVPEKGSSAFAENSCSRSVLVAYPAFHKDWLEARPYVRTHLAVHAAAAGILGELIADPTYLVTAEPGRCSRRSHETGEVRRAYQQAFKQLVGKPPGERLAYLQLAARCTGAAFRADATVPTGGPDTSWSAGPRQRARRARRRPRSPLCWRSTSIRCARCAICLQNCLRSTGSAACHGAALRRIEPLPTSECCLRQKASLSSAR